MAIRAVNSGGVATTNIMVRGVNIGNAASGHTTLSAAITAASSGDTIVFTENFEVTGSHTISGLTGLTITADDSSWFGTAGVARHAYGSGARISNGGSGATTVIITGSSDVLIERLQIETNAANIIGILVDDLSNLDIRAYTLHGDGNGECLRTASTGSGDGTCSAEFGFTELYTNCKGYFNNTATDGGIQCRHVYAIQAVNNAGICFEGGGPGARVELVNCYAGWLDGVSASTCFVNCTTPSGYGAGHNGTREAAAPPGSTTYTDLKPETIMRNSTPGSMDARWSNYWIAAMFPGIDDTSILLASRDIDEETLGSDFLMGPDYRPTASVTFSSEPLFDLQQPDGEALGEPIDAEDGYSLPAYFMTPNPTGSLSVSKFPAGVKTVSGLNPQAPITGTRDIDIADFQMPDGETILDTYEGIVAENAATGLAAFDFTSPGPTWPTYPVSKYPPGAKTVSGLNPQAPGTGNAGDETWIVDSPGKDFTEQEAWLTVFGTELRAATMDFQVPFGIVRYIPEGGADGSAEVLAVTPLLLVTFDAPATTPDPLIDVSPVLLGDLVAGSDLGLLREVPFIVYGIDILSTDDLDDQHVPNGLPFLVDASFSEGPGDPIYDAGGRANYVGVRTSQGMVFRPPVDKEVALYVRVTTDLQTAAIEPGTGVPVGFRKYEARSTPVWHPYKPMPEKALEAQYIFQILDPDEIYRYYSLLVSEMYIIWQNLNDDLTKLLSPDETLDEWLDLLAEQYLIPLDRSRGFERQRKEIGEWLRVPRVRGTAKSVIVPIRHLNHFGRVFEIWADPEEPTPTNWDDVADAPAAIQTHMMTIGIYDDQVTESGQKGIDFVVVPHGFFHEVPAQDDEGGNFYPTGRLAVVISDLDHQPIPIGSLSSDDLEALRDNIVSALNEVIPAHSDIRLFAEGLEVAGDDPPHEALEISDSLSTTDIPWIIDVTPVLSGTFVVT